jgi:ATPase involved in DNA replication initiation
MRPTDNVSKKMICDRDEFLRLVCDELNVSPLDVMGEKRDERTTRARHLVMWALHTCCKASKTQIGAAMGRNHATVLYALRAVDNAIETPNGGEVKKIVKLIKAKGEALV